MNEVELTALAERVALLEVALVETTRVLEQTTAIIDRHSATLTNLTEIAKLLAEGRRVPSNERS